MRMGNPVTLAVNPVRKDRVGGWAVSNRWEFISLKSDPK